MIDTTEKTEFEVRRITITKLDTHPNADKLSLIDVEGYPVVVRTQDFKVGDSAIYIPVDALVPTDRPCFQFLFKEGRTTHRIKAQRFRGVFSMGLLIPDQQTGSGSLQEDLGITKWIPIAEREAVLHAPPQKNHGRKSPKLPVYGLDGFRKYGHVLQVGEEVVISEKIHGCVPPGAKILMADGSYRKIKDIQVGEYVMGMEGGRTVPSKVLQTFDNGVTDNWLEFHTTSIDAGVGPSYRVFSCTPNHQIFSNNQYIEAGMLSVGDKVMISRTRQCLDPIQIEVLNGKMLGDGSFGPTSDIGCSVVWGHDKSKEAYMDWIASCLGQIVHPKRDYPTSGYGTPMTRQRTVNSTHILEMQQKWVMPTCNYHESLPFHGDTCKEVPESIKLSPISLAFWYMDDGSLSHHEGQLDRATFATNGFNELSCQRLAKALSELGLEATVFYADGFRIRLIADAAERMFMMIAPYIPECMQYKLPERWRGAKPWFPKLEYKPQLVSQTITEITHRREMKPKRDLETETHNFFVGGVLVHNSNFRAAFIKGRLWVGSHKVMRGSTPSPISDFFNRMWLKVKSFLGMTHRAHTLEKVGDIWWQVAGSLNLKERLSKYPNHVLFGEVYGEGVQDLTYDSPVGRKFRAFDVYDLERQRFLDFPDFLQFIQNIGLTVEEHVVPILEVAPWSKELQEKWQKWANTAKTTLGGGHLTEGVVIKPTVERMDPRCGRVGLKFVSEQYLMRKDE